MPHRAICGKDKIDTPVEAKPRTMGHDKGIPLPDPGFKRSAALLHQISLLKRGDVSPDYVVSFKLEQPAEWFADYEQLINPPPLDDVGIQAASGK